MEDLKNKNVIVTGGTSGIGKSAVYKLAEKGCNVIFCGRNKESGKNIEKDLVNIGHNVGFIQCDVTDKSALEGFFESAISHLGVVDIAYNNAGIDGEIAEFSNSTEENWDNVFNVNLKSLWRCMQYEIKHMLENGKGNILNMSSTSGLVGNGFGMSAYAASKHAVIGLTKSVALEYVKRNIRVNALCPAFVETPMIDAICNEQPKLRRRFEACQPMGRMAKPEEIANAVAYLCSDASSFITGSAFTVDGGLTV